MKESNYRIHLLYWAIIFVVLAIFLILCVPGRINEYAFSNFSFASVLVSIVLAVISIILSISVGQSTTHFNLEIKDVEKEIQNKLQRFDDLEQSIRSSVEEIVKKEVDSVKKSQNEMNTYLVKLATSAGMYRPNVNQSEESFDINSKSYLCIASLYLAALCHRTGKPIPLTQLKYPSLMIVGFLNALSSVEPKTLLITSKDHDVYVSEFSSSRWGEEEELKELVNGIDNSVIKDVVLKAANSLLSD